MTLVWLDDRSLLVTSVSFKPSAALEDPDGAADNILRFVWSNGWQERFNWCTAYGYPFAIDRVAVVEDDLTTYQFIWTFTDPDHAFHFKFRFA